MPEFKISKNKLLTLFVDRMMVDKGIDGMSLGEQADLRQALAKELDTEIQSAMLEALSIEQLEELDRRLDDGMTDEELELFFEYSEGVDFQAVVSGAMERFRAAYLGSKAVVEEIVEIESDEDGTMPSVLIGDLEGAY